MLLRRSGDDAMIIVMLGTNDILAEAEPEDTAEHMQRFLEELRELMPQSIVLLIAPPPLTELGEEYFLRSEELAADYERTAEELHLCYADTSSWQIPMGSDGVHFSELGHRLFAVKMGQTIRALLA